MYADDAAHRRGFTTQSAARRESWQLQNHFAVAINEKNDNYLHFFAFLCLTYFEQFIIIPLSCIVQLKREQDIQKRIILCLEVAKAPM